MGGGPNNSPRRALLSRPWYIRSLRMCNSASLIVPFKAEQQAVVVVGRIVQAVGVRQQGAEAGAQLQQLVPVLAGARQSAHLQAEDEADVIQSDLGQQSLEAEAALGGLAAEAEVVVDDGNVLVWPAQSGRAI